MGFEKREVLLILGVVFLMVGVLPFVAPVYAVTIAVTVYLGMRLFVKKRKQQIQKVVGEGICAVCGSKILQKSCPVCDDSHPGQDR